MGFSRPLVMGILNITPDSFSDGGKYPTVQVAIAHAGRMIAEGADWIDIGGESTRPNAEPVEPLIEQRRVIPVIEQLCDTVSGARISIDTRNSETAKLAIEAGAQMVNDVSGGLHDKEILSVVAKTEAQYVIMHMRGSPLNMAELTKYKNVADDVKQELLTRVGAAIKAGIDKSKVLIDPGIGFAKTPEQSYQLLRELSKFCDTDYRVVVGCSRKRLIGFIDQSTPDKRLGGSVALAAYSVLQGAAMVRVHDVAETRQAVDVAAYLRGFAKMQFV